MKYFVLIIGFALMSACAHHRDVRPGSDGIHRVVVMTDDKEEGAQGAIRQANHFCEERKQSAAFLNEEQKYTGDIDEKDYQTGKKISTVAKTVGGAVWAFGGKNESAAGGLVGLGGVAADKALGKGYTVEMRFKCQ